MWQHSAVMVAMATHCCASIYMCGDGSYGNTEHIAVLVMWQHSAVLVSMAMHCCAGSYGDVVL